MVVEAIAAASLALGWPHAITPAERRGLTAFASRDVAAWIGTTPDRGGCTFRACTFAWREGGTVRLSLRVWEDGSYRITTAVAGWRATG